MKIIDQKRMYDLWTIEGALIWERLRKIRDRKNKIKKLKDKIYDKS
jgi:hypothetical protein